MSRLSRIRSVIERRGSILLMSAGIMIMLLAFTAFTLDTGFIVLAKGQMQNAVDGAALAAAMELDPNADQDVVAANARAAADEIASMYRVGDQGSFNIDPLADVELGRMTYDSSTDSYTFDFDSSATPYNVVRVWGRRKIVEHVEENTTIEVDNRLPLFFAPVIGHTHSALELSAVATFQPRDIALVLDYSASMNDDSELKSIGSLGQTAVEANIQQMWEELGSPTYGHLAFTPDWVTVPGASHPVEVTWRTSSVDVESEEAMDYVRLYFSDGSYQTFSTNATSGTWSGTGSKSGNRITKVRIWIDGVYETIDFYDDATIVRGLGLDTVSYPYASGSWSDYVNYARNHSSSMSWYDSYVYTAGYRRKFGMLTLINFWNKNKPRNDQTADLWKISQQPIGSLKDSVDVLMDYLISAGAEDQVALSIYTYPDSTGGLLESGLTTDYESLKTISRQRQAGHYDNMTNIGAGMTVGREELVNNARPKAARMMILITDGIANRTSTDATPEQYALDEADLCAAANIKIMTISLGLNADTDLMQDIADRTGGQHFNVPGGSGVAAYSAELQSVFEQIAASRPLKLISVD